MRKPGGRWLRRRAPVSLRALVLVLLAPVAVLAVTLVSGLLSAPEPPDTEGASGGAVLRVIAPEGKLYRIFWNYETLATGSVEDKAAYKDYEVPPEAGSLEEGFNLALERVENEAGEKWDGPLQAILFVEGEYATCSASGAPVVRLYWRPDRGANGLLMRATCGRYRYA